MNKIKIIDLLNKMVNGEKVPLKIKYNKKIYTRDENYSIAYIKRCEENGEKIVNKYFYHNGLDNLLEEINNGSYLIDEAEIIEDAPKNAKDELIEMIDMNRYWGTDLSITDDIVDRLNKVIDKVNSI